MTSNNSKITVTTYHKSLNNFLSICVILLAAYIVVSPLLPAIIFYLPHTQIKNARPHSTLINTNGETAHINTLSIPGLHLTEEIFEGTDDRTLEKGVWHRPNTSKPEEGSNTVLVGHRFTYSQGAVFYNLDKIGVNDELSLQWDDKKYTYQVSSIQIVSPTAVQIENPTIKPVLTLYTCTPLWTDQQRLVITATLKE